MQASPPILWGSPDPSYEGLGLITSGQITIVCPEQRHFCLKTGPFPSQSFFTTDQTRLKYRGRSVELADLSAGDRVTVHYIRGNGKHIARSLDVETKGH